MTVRGVLWGGVAAAALGLLAVPAAEACSPADWKACEGKPWVIGKAETPIGEAWWPSKLWGAGDEAGSTNWFKKPEVVQRGLKEADKGKTYKLGRPYQAAMPMFGARQFSLRIPGSPTGGPFGANNLLYNDEFLATEVGQVGTQFDGLGHIGVMVNGPGDKAQMRYYNGFTDVQVGNAYGLQKIGAEKLHPIVTRGVLIDVGALKGDANMNAGTEITMADVRAALDKQGMANFKFEPGDGVFFRTGWSRHWIKDNAAYNAGAPGIGMEVAKWLSDEVQVGLVGADTWPTEVVPNPDPGCVFCVHSHLITRHGIVNHENMHLDDLAADRVYTFLYMFSPAPIVGATGSMGAPVAID